MQQRRSILNWLGLGLLVLLVVALVRLSGSDQRITLPEEQAPSASTVDSTSPLVKQSISPLSSPLDSPLPISAPPSLPTVTPTSVSGFRLTLVHTNDTWGYLDPCG